MKLAQRLNKKETMPDFITGESLLVKDGRMML